MRFGRIVAGVAALGLLGVAVLPGAAFAHGVVDQVSEGAGGVACRPGRQFVQTFVPQASTLVAVDLKLNNDSSSAFSVSVLIETQDGVELATEPVTVAPGPFAPTTHVEFDPLITLTPGDVYKIVLTPVGAEICVDPSGSYSFGALTLCLADGSCILPPEDLWFRTYAAGPNADADADGDGVSDADDVCPGTDLPDGILQLKVNRFAANTVGVFVDAKRTPSGYTIADTGGCSATQIIAAAGLGKAHARFGVTRSALDTWVASLA
jgi:hypothetical protein